jgi:hypothetical protein
VPQVDVTLYLGTNLTSKNPATGFSEALLLIDEPNSGIAGAPKTLLPCTGTCSITSDGNTLDTYNGSAGHPNVFQAQSATGNSIVWTNIPLDPPGVNSNRILRITNLRANASLFGSGTAQSPTTIVTFVSIGGSEFVTINNPQTLVANAESSLSQQTGGVATLSQCTSANPSIAANPSQPLNTGSGNGAQFAISETESFGDVFKVKNYAETEANAGPPFPTLYPADVAQDIPGFPYYTETGFFDPSFPTTQGLNTIGSASSGTRVSFQFSAIPAGVQLYVPISVPLTAMGAPTNETGIAVLTATDINGAGPYTPVVGNPSGLAPVTITGTTGMAVYEILYANPTTQETLTLPVAAAYLSGKVSAGTINVQASLAPLSTVEVADGISPIPRFTANGTVTPAFTIQACTQTTGSTTKATGATAVYSTNAQTVSMTAVVTTTAGPVTGGTVTFTVAGTTLPPVPVQNGGAGAFFTFAGLLGGSYPIAAQFSGFANIAASSDSSQVLTITKQPLTVTWATPGSIVYGTALSSVQLNATAKVPGTYVYAPPSGTVLKEGYNQKLSVTFTPTDSVDYQPATATTYVDVLAPSAPFGSFDTPAATSNVSGSVPFTGWALSPAGITGVDIWREDAGKLVFIGDADFVTGARTDVLNDYPGYPENNSAGWGYLMLTNELPGGNGTFQIHAIAHDTKNASTDLGTKTIIVNNADATQPFGSIDTPIPGGTESGIFVNFGWALTPPGKMIPIDGSTIWVFIDNQRMGHPVYNNYRADIATLFPGYENSLGAIGYYYVDTTQLTNGLHTIAWTVTDDAGVASGIGSRYFIVQN